MPDSLYEKVEKHYAVIPDKPVCTSTQQKGEFVEDTVDWLDGLWESGQIADCMTYEQYLEFRESIKLFAEYEF